MHEKHGHFIRIAHNEISVSHPDAVKEILSAPLDKARESAQCSSIQLQIVNFRQGTMGVKQVSKFLANGYSFSNLLRREDEMDVLLEVLKQRMDHFAEKRQAMNVSAFLSYAAHDVAGEMLFSNPFGFLKSDSDVGGTIRNFPPLNLYVSIAGFFYWIHTILLANPLVTRLGILPTGHIVGATRKALDERLRNADHRYDVLSHWLSSHAKHPDKFSTRDIYSNAILHMAASAETVSIAIQANLYYLIRHPDILRRVREEIQAAQLKGSCKTCIVSYDDAKELVYLRACIQESLRLCAPITLNLARVVGEEGLAIGGRWFKKGTILSVNPWVMHLSKEYWGPSASNFKPERWMTDEGVLREKNFIPFGAGYNSCPGQNLAMIEILKIVATIMRDYDLSQDDKDREWTGKAQFVFVPPPWLLKVSKKEDL
ncbi:hypothetical protein HIM_08947 [Hirsutella minnesotensis 3608]|uniref:Uncharacterized protein n=1 Tax=Hirsutella minnesotensis 3608 TaxID=1043627 RepID=A0A0F7ZM11_9HYPO|nr:hypothetical protein HIM_08947 [Hirsutella minnesotensis 3608]